jgi:hypothetical protein
MNFFKRTIPLIIAFIMGIMMAFNTTCLMKHLNLY